MAALTDEYRAERRRRLKVVPRDDKLDALAVKIGREVEAAEADFVSAVKHAIRAGELLIEAKAQMKHGKWLDWVNSVGLCMSARTAQRYMAVARNASRVSHTESINAALEVLAEPRDGGPLRSAAHHVPGKPPAAGPPGQLSHPWFRKRPDEPLVKGAFAWFGPWVVECPDCGCDLYRNMRTDSPTNMRRASEPPRKDEPPRVSQGGARAIGPKRSRQAYPHFRHETYTPTPQ
jgi:hypothetical protein